MIEVDNKKVLSLFANLNSKKQQKVFNNALKKGAQVLVKETRKQLRKGVKNTTKKNIKYGKSLSQGVKFKVKNNEAKVHIMGDFRLKFFEMGTNIRKTRKGWKRGKINAKRFFANAKANKEKEIFSNINTYISDSIKKVAKK